MCVGRAILQCERDPKQHWLMLVPSEPVSATNVPPQL